MKMLVIAYSEQAAKTLAGKLLEDSTFFSVTPLPLEAWRFDVKEEEVEAIKERIRGAA